MDFDIFLSISQTPVDGETPDEDTMYSNFFEQLESADQLGLSLIHISEPTRPY